MRATQVIKIVNYAPLAGTVSHALTHSSVSGFKAVWNVCGDSGEALRALETDTRFLCAMDIQVDERDKERGSCKMVVKGETGSYECYMPRRNGDEAPLTVRVDRDRPRPRSRLIRRLS